MFEISYFHELNPKILQLIAENCPLLKKFKSTTPHNMLLMSIDCQNFGQQMSQMVRIYKI
jgi:hypothetical protein